MSDFVAADAQFANVRVIKPFQNFEGVYQGQSAAIPIQFFEVGKNPRDGAAAERQVGFDRNLSRGIPMPFGSRVCLWLPMAVSSDGAQQPTLSTQNYQYFIAWRYRNVRDFRNPPGEEQRKPWHIPQQRAGQPDTRPAPNGGERSFLPAAIRSVVYEMANPGALANAVQDLRVETVVPKLNFPAIQPPLLPDGTAAALQQGVLDPGVFGPQATNPLYMPFWTDTEGDEMMIFATREDVTAPGATWDFTDSASDLPFSDVYGTGNGTHAILPDAGILITQGTNP